MHATVPGLKLSALQSICQVIDQAMDLQSALDGVLKILSEQLSMQRATVTLFDPETGQLSINASYGLSIEEKQRGVYKLDEGVTGRIFQTG
ncbi:MAG TPA: AAA family ATPase, partial [Pseudodesulfovibrio sp.]|nr:AAA family ATPase [Pseudodesulfovibrio sp.]